MRVLLVLAVVAVTFVSLVAAGCNPTAAYSSGYTNVDSTYYGDGGAGGGGTCSISYPRPAAGTSKIYATAAIGKSAWGGSEACGMCVNITYRGTGSGANPPISGSVLFVDNYCAECGYGLDIGKSFDGRWQIDWKAVPCDVGDSKFQFVFQGSHEWYIKLQVRNTRYPVASLAIVQDNVVKPLVRQNDNFWLAGSTVTFPITVSTTKKLELRITSTFGDTVTDYVSEISTTVRDGTAQFPNCGGSSSGSAATTTTSAKSTTTTTTTSSKSTTSTTSSKSTTSTTSSKSTTTSSKSTTSTTGSKSTTSTTKAPSTSTSAKAATTTTTGKAATTTTTGKAATTGTGSTTGSTASGTDVYLDDVVPPIQDWSWGPGQVTRQSTAVTAYAGTKCYELKPIEWAAVYFRYFDSNGGTSFTSSLFKSLEFYIRSPTSAPVNSLQFAFVVGSDGKNPSTQYMSGTNIPSSWTKVTITVPSGSSFSGFWIQDADSYVGGPNNTYPVYFDNFRLLKA